MLQGAYQIKMPLYTFKRPERLKSKKLIDELFLKGHSFNIHPFRVFWMLSPVLSACPAQVIIGASKRNIRHAVGRNRMKRLMREAYRLQKNRFYDFLTDRQTQCLLAMVYTGNERADFHEVTGKITSVLRRLEKEIEEHLNKQVIHLSNLKNNTNEK